MIFLLNGTIVKPEIKDNYNLLIKSFNDVSKYIKKNKLHDVEAIFQVIHCGTEFDSVTQRESHCLSWSGLGFYSRWCRNV